MADNSSYPITQIERNPYYTLGNRTTASVPNQFYYDPQLTVGVFYVYPRFTAGSKLIEFTYHRPFEDFDSSGDTPDFPQHWYQPLMLELAYMLGPKFGVPPEERAALFKEAQFYIQQALSNDQPTGSLYLGPDYRF